MLLLLTQLNAGGPKVEMLFRDALQHPEANVRKEALPGLAKILKSGAAEAVAAALDDDNLEVRKRAAACLGLTGIADASVYRRLAALLSGKHCNEELAIQIAASLNRIRPEVASGAVLEPVLLDLLGVGGVFRIGGRKGTRSDALKLAVVQALGYVGRERTVKALDRLSGQKVELDNAIRETLARIAERE
jgi:HEAT repeat protein